MEKGSRVYHFLDRYVGIPSVFLLGVFRKRKRQKPQLLHRIAIINLFSIGDNVLMSGVIADLVFAYPQAELVAFVANSNYQLVKLIPGFTQIHKLPISNPFKSIRLIRREKKFDLVLDFGSWPRASALYSFFIRGSYKIGFKSEGQFRHYVFDQKVKYLSDIHEIDNYRNLVNKIYHFDSHHPPKIIYQSSPKGVSLIKGFNNNYCIIHPWPGGYKSYMKEWSNKNWSKLIGLIYKDFDKIVITGAPSDVNKTEALMSEIKSNPLIDNVISVAGDTSLIETIDLIVNSKIIFSVNTGIAHIAASFDVDQICLHGPTDVKRWRPYSSKSISVVPSLGKFGYLNYGFEYELAEGNCMDNISVDFVYNTYLGLKKSENIISSS